ncbi:MAG: hypothetical protein M3N53_13040 [Actinomycetota bacterium]|nr:hypothetical protein [Actinomycetota bacterium]
MRRVAALALALALASGCSTPASQAEAPTGQTSPSPAVSVDRETFEVLRDRSGEPEEEVWVRADVINHSSQPLTPTCYLIDRAVGVVTLDDAAPLQPGERRRITGTASFPVPSFNYECDGFCKGVKCFVAGLEPRYIKGCLEMYERIPAAGTGVKVPNVNGMRLSDVATPLYKRGLKVEIGRDVERDWRDRTGPLGDLKPANVLRRVMLNLLLVVGPRVRVTPPPGSNIRAGQSVVLHRF